jgi:Ser/Thr protein kinase RdoA (MazF antagonist)
MPTCDLAQQILAPLPRTETGGPPSKFLVVPAVGEPRWLLPHGCRNIDSVLSSWSPYRFSSRLKWRAVRAANRIGALQSLSNSTISEIRNPAEIDWHSLGWNSSTPPVPIVYVGTPGVSRKAAIHLVDQASGQCGAIVKVPLAEGAKRAILREADTLAALAEEKYACAPRLLHIDRHLGLATQEFIAGVSGGRRFTAEHWKLLTSLLRPDESASLVAQAAKLQERLLWSPAFESHLHVMSAALAELCDPRPLPACWVHGDFAPWNVKHAGTLAPMLIDWEDAHRDGLPLHDAYHFLHMQDYVFGERPAVHSAALEAFAKTLGITTAQCRKLEIAYLADSYLQCIAQNNYAHADFLGTTLNAALQARRHQVVTPGKKAGMHIVARHPVHNSRQMRSQLFAALIAQLNSTGIRYCILSGCEDDPADNTSDVDIMVHPRDMSLIPAVLAQSGRRAGTHIVQALQHETTGCYFVLARQNSSQTSFLDPDFCDDYRKDGRLWLLAEDVLAHCRRYKDFYVPSLPGQFTYYLVKKVLKQSITSHQLKRLQHCYARDPAECQRRLVRFWPQTTAPQLQRAIVEQNLSWFQARMEALLLELKRSTPVERRFDRCMGKLRDLLRVLRRAVCPTGMSVLVVGGTRDLRAKIADGLLQSVAPAFRWTAKATLASTLPSAVSLAARIFYARRRSTLVVSTADPEWPAVGLPRSRRQLRWILTRLFFHPDLVLTLDSHGLAANLETAGQGDDRVAPDLHARKIYLDVRSSPESIVTEGSHAVLHWLASRLERRLTGSGSSVDRDPSFDPAAAPVALRSTGSD